MIIHIGGYRKVKSTKKLAPAKAMMFERWLREMTQKFERVLLLEHPDLKGHAKLGDSDVAAVQAVRYVTETAHEQLKRDRWDVQEKQ
jgi:hypothetical protein